MVLGILFIVVMVILDQLSKYWAVTRLASRTTIPIITDVFHLTYAENRGAAFSMLQNATWLLIAVTATALLLIVIALWKHWIDGALAHWAAYFVLAGGIGNLIDRVVNGYVVDLFDFRLINFAIFNIADVCICIGGGLFVLYVIQIMLTEKKAQNQENHHADS